MLRIRKLLAMELKRMVEVISTVYLTAKIQFLKDAIIFWVLDTKTRIYAELKIKASFFHQYDIRRPFIVNFELSKLNSFLVSKADDEDEVFISIDHYPITHLDLWSFNPCTNKTYKETLRAAESSATNTLKAQPTYEFQIGMPADYFEMILEHSASIKQPIHITITNMLVSLASGSALINLIKEDDKHCKTDSVPQKMRYELELCLYDQADCFILASRIAQVMYLKDSHSGSGDMSPLLEFQIGCFARLRFYIRHHYWVP